MVYLSALLKVAMMVYCLVLMMTYPWVQLMAVMKDHNSAPDLARLKCLVTMMDFEVLSNTQHHSNELAIESCYEVSIEIYPL